MWTNGEQISHYHRKDPNYFEEITDIPREIQSLENVFTERFTLKDLVIKDKIANERKSLKGIILEMEDEVLANAGVDVFEEVFKLIFTKLYDEFLSQRDKEIINHFVRLATATAVSQPDSSDYIGGQDYESIKKAVSKVDGYRFSEHEVQKILGRTDTELKHKIQGLFDEAKQEWPGVFPEGFYF